MKNIFSTLSRKASSLLDKAKLTEHTFMIIIAIIIGIMGGFAAIGIRALIEGISDLSFPEPVTILKTLLQQNGIG